MSDVKRVRGSEVPHFDSAHNYWVLASDYDAIAAKYADLEASFKQGQLDHDALAAELAEAKRERDDANTVRAAFARSFNAEQDENDALRAALWDLVETVGRISWDAHETDANARCADAMSAARRLVDPSVRTAVQPTVRHCECLIPSRTPFNRNWCHTCGYEIRATDQTPAGPTK